MSNLNNNAEMTKTMEDYNTLKSLINKAVERLSTDEKMYIIYNTPIKSDGSYGDLSENYEDSNMSYFIYVMSKINNEDITENKISTKRILNLYSTDVELFKKIAKHAKKACMNYFLEKVKNLNELLHKR